VLEISALKAGSKSGLEHGANSVLETPGGFQLPSYLKGLEYVKERSFSGCLRERGKHEIKRKARGKTGS
jgi:hypothetical protein